MVEFEIGDCPKCEKRTFVVYDYAADPGAIYLKGRCYKCGFETIAAP